MTRAAPWFAAGAALILGALLLGWWLVSTGVPRVDVALSDMLAGWRDAAWFWLALTRAGDAPGRIIFTIAVATPLWVRRRRRDALLLPVASALEVAFNSGLKLLFDRGRPTLFDHLDHVTTLSYPSGHAAHAMCLLLLAGLLVGRSWAVAAGVALAMAIGVSRVVLGVHWPSDVIGGWAFGGGCALLAFGARRLAYGRPSQTLL